MSKKDYFQERRKHKRFRAKRGVFAVSPPNFDKLGQGLIHSLIVVLNVFILFVIFRYVKDIQNLGDKTITVLYFIVFISMVSLFLGLVADKNFGMTGSDTSRKMIRAFEIYLPLLAVCLAIVITIIQ